MPNYASRRTSAVAAGRRICYAWLPPNESRVEMKFLLLLALFLAVYLLLRKAAAARSSARSPAPRPPERMVKCAYCGVNQPVSESLLTHGRYYCCDAHRREAEARDG